MKEITCDLIDEGRMLNSLDDSLQKVAAEVVKHAAMYDDPQTCKGSVQLMIEVKASALFDNAYHIDWKMKTINPQLPKRSTLAYEKMGKIMVENSGSNANDPRQMQLPGVIENERTKNERGENE